MATPALARQRRPRSNYLGPVVDCDVHHDWKSQEDLYPYLSSGWLEYVTGKAGPDMPLRGTGLPWANPVGVSRLDATPFDGGRPGSDYETMRDQLFERFDVRKAVLTHGSMLFGSNRVKNPYFGVEVARAANRWTVEQWLSRDDRLVGSILTTTHIPEVAAADIRHFAKHEQMGQVLIAGNAHAQPLGHPIFHPILEAAAEVGLPVALHSGGQGWGYRPAAGGELNFYLEFHALRMQPVMVDVTSLILHGVFEKFPSLKVLLVEAGTAWVPALFWRLDADYKGLRREVPWLKRLPSEYFAEFFRLTTQPLETSPERDGLVKLLDSVGGRELIMFSTDYPHWDADEVDYVATRLPKDWLPDVFWGNAAKFYGWDPALFEPRVDAEAEGARR